MRRPMAVLLALAGAAAFGSYGVSVASASQGGGRLACEDGGVTCTETFEPKTYEGKYVGHDEPSVLFYSNRKGSGYDNTYRLTLPKDPPNQPQQNGSGGTFSFQLHPTFWLGLAVCDSESAPEYTHTCTPDSNKNIYDNPDPNSNRYIGKHPGGAYMEMQFYPPSWVEWPPGNSCDPTKWCAALNIDSFNEDQSTGTFNNNDCLSKVGTEPVNFAFITKTGTPHSAPGPLEAFSPPFDAITPNAATDLFMGSGDKLVVHLHDTSSGLEVDITDLTTGATGSMIASGSNGFSQVVFDPSASTCTERPYDFHPMYASSSEHTRLTWTAHGYNVAFSDEIGHFEYCDTVNPDNTCGSSSTDPGGADGDEFPCFPGSASSLIDISGCLGSDIDFDGSSYGLNWPGTGSNPVNDRKNHPTTFLFTSPTFDNGTRNYKRVAFEVDLPRIEAPDSGGICDRTTGANCVNPPAGAAFYPLYTTNKDQGHCVWQEGGTGIPGTTNTFGGTSTTEYGPLLQLFYPIPGGVVYRYNNFRNVLPSNPCGFVKAKH